jgi:hypothetical protein
VDDCLENPDSPHKNQNNIGFASIPLRGNF